MQRMVVAALVGLFTSGALAQAPATADSQNPQPAWREIIVRKAEDTKGASAASSIVRARLGDAFTEGFALRLSQRTVETGSEGDAVYEVEFYSQDLATYVIAQLETAAGPNLRSYIEVY